MIHVCDAIMGSGKSQSAIALMNSNPKRKFIYITPYLDEAERIRDCCPSLRFAIPSKRNPKYNFSKVEHTRSLLAAGRNVATTHSAFCLYTQDMIESIREYDYTLIIDEAVNVLTEMEGSAGDIDLLEAAGCIKQVGDGTYALGETPYGGDRLSDIYEMCRRNSLVRVGSAGVPNGDDYFFYWELQPDVLASFGEVYILTYLFGGQDIKYYLDGHNLPYDFIGIRRTRTGYEFSSRCEYVPAYVAHLSDMISIVDEGKLNQIGDGKFALSSGWFNRRASKDDLDRLRKNMVTFFRFRDVVPSSDRMWTCFDRDVRKIKDKGIGEHTPCNLRAMNRYSNKTALAYCVNVFANPFKKRYLSTSGREYNEDEFALSVLIQWIWRSAIRNGRKIQLYIPSQRMRTLLRDWIYDTQKRYGGIAEGGECNA